MSTRLPTWIPGERCRRWLGIGIVALLVDLVLGVVSTVLELIHWGEGGVTPDVVVMVIAIVPQCLVATTYLVLARDVQLRGLWKSTAGMLSCYLLLVLFGVVMLEILPPAGNVAVMILVAIGLAAVLVFSASDLPRFETDTDTASPDVERQAGSASSDGPGWGGGLAIFAVFLVVRFLFRRFARPVFPGGFDIDDWQLLELFAAATAGLSFAVWFAATKIRHRRTLGTMAGVTGTAELLILVVHVALAATIFAVMINAAIDNPEMSDEAVDKLLDPWTKLASLTSAACHALWCILTMKLFAAISSGRFHPTQSSQH